MDLNQLFHREGEARLRAAWAVAGPARDAHLELADHYRARIDHRRRIALELAGLRPSLPAPAC